MNCNRRGVYTNNPPTQGSSRCVCCNAYTQINITLNDSHNNKSSRVHSTAQRCQTIIAMTPFYRQRTVTMHQQLRLVLSKTGAPHNETNCSRCAGHPSRAVTCYEYALAESKPNQHTTHNTTLCGYRSTIQIRKPAQPTHMSVCTCKHINTRRIIGFAVDHLKYSRLLTRLHCRWQRGMPLGYRLSRVGRK